MKQKVALLNNQEGMERLQSVREVVKGDEVPI